MHSDFRRFLRAAKARFPLQLRYKHDAAVNQAAAHATGRTRRNRKG